MSLFWSHGALPRRTHFPIATSLSAAETFTGILPITMSDESAPATEASKPGGPKNGIAWKLRRVAAILVFMLVAVLGVRTVAFALSEKKYKSTARIFLTAAKERAERYPNDFMWGPPSLEPPFSQEFCSPMIAERSQSQMRALYPTSQPQVCEAEAINIPGTFTYSVSATATDATYAQTYLDMLIKEFRNFRKEESEVISKAREQALQFGTMTAKPAGTSSEKLAETKAALDQFHRPSKELTEQLAKDEAQQRETPEEVTILEPASPAVRVIPRFTFLRLF